MLYRLFSKNIPLILYVHTSSTQLQTATCTHITGLWYFYQSMYGVSKCRTGDYTPAQWIFTRAHRWPHKILHVLVSRMNSFVLFLRQLHLHALFLILRPILRIPSAHQSNAEQHSNESRWDSLYSTGKSQRSPSYRSYGATEVQVHRTGMYVSLLQNIILAACSKL